MRSVANTVKKVPSPVWALICIAIAIFYAIVVPNTGEAGNLRYIILRWFHSLAWIFLALSFFLRMSSATKMRTVAKFVAFLALPTYVLFFAVMVFPTFLA